MRRGLGFRRPRARSAHPPAPRMSREARCLLSDIANPRRPQAPPPSSSSSPPPPRGPQSDPGPICLDNERKCFKTPPGRETHHHHPRGGEERTPPAWTPGRRKPAPCGSASVRAGRNGHFNDSFQKVTKQCEAWFPSPTPFFYIKKCLRGVWDDITQGVWKRTEPFPCCPAAWRARVGHARPDGGPVRAGLCSARGPGASRPRVRLCNCSEVRPSPSRSQKQQCGFGSFSGQGRKCTVAAVVVPPETGGPELGARVAGSLCVMSGCWFVL